MQAWSRVTRKHWCSTKPGQSPHARSPGRKRVIHRPYPQGLLVPSCSVCPQPTVQVIPPCGLSDLLWPRSPECSIGSGDHGGHDLTVSHIAIVAVATAEDHCGRSCLALSGTVWEGGIFSLHRQTSPVRASMALPPPPSGPFTSSGVTGGVVDFAVIGLLIILAPLILPSLRERRLAWARGLPAPILHLAAAFVAPWFAGKVGGHSTRGGA